METKWKKLIPLMVVAGLALAGIGYYIIANQVGMPTRGGVGTEPAGFWLGIWQGAIVCLSFIASWFDGDVILYQANNTGLWYNLGFLLGLCISIGGSASRSQSKKDNSSCCNEGE